MGNSVDMQGAQHMSNDTTQHQDIPQGRHIDPDADEFDIIAMTEPDSAYGPAWRERFTSRHHLHNSLAS